MALVIAVDNSSGSSGTSCWSQLRIHAALPTKARLERLALHEAHHEIQQLARLPERMQRHDVGMRQPRSGPRLAKKALAGITRCGQLGRKHLDGHLPVEEGLARQVDASHAAAPHQPNDLVLRTERRFEQRHFDIGMVTRHLKAPTRRDATAHDISARAKPRPGLLMRILPNRFGHLLAL